MSAGQVLALGSQCVVQRVHTPLTPAKSATSHPYSELQKASLMSH
jgi:hypothetical protein